MCYRVVADISVLLCCVSGRHEDLVDHVDDSIGCWYVSKDDVCVVDHHSFADCEGQVVSVHCRSGHAISHCG